MSAPTDRQFEEWADWFTCLANPTRLRILHYVAGLAAPAPVGEIVHALGLTQSNVSHHLRTLAEQRFVITRAEGVRTLVSANPQCIVELPEAAAAIMRVDRPADRVSRHP